MWFPFNTYQVGQVQRSVVLGDRLLLSVELVLHLQMRIITKTVHNCMTWISREMQYNMEMEYLY